MQDQGLSPIWKKVDEYGSVIFKSVVFRNWMQQGITPHSIQLPSAPYFISTDRKQIDNYINELNKYAVFNSWFIQNAQTAVSKAISLDSLIKKEYHLE